MRFPGRPGARPGPRRFTAPWAQRALSRTSQQSPRLHVRWTSAAQVNSLQVSSRSNLATQRSQLWPANDSLWGPRFGVRWGSTMRSGAFREALLRDFYSHTGAIQCRWRQESAPSNAAVSFPRRRQRVPSIYEKRPRFYYPCFCAITKQLARHPQPRGPLFLPAGGGDGWRPAASNSCSGSISTAKAANVALTRGRKQLLSPAHSWQHNNREPSTRSHENIEACATHIGAGTAQGTVGRAADAV